MKSKGFLTITLLTALIVIIPLMGCGNHYRIRTLEATLLKVSDPYYYHGSKVVDLTWRYAQPVITGHKVDEPTPNETEEEVWAALPVEKIPLDILGKYVEKSMTITYGIIIYSKPEKPLVFIEDFKLH